MGGSLSSTTYTFGPPGQVGASATTPPEAPKKQSFTFGPPKVAPAMKTPVASPVAKPPAGAASVKTKTPASTSTSNPEPPYQGGYYGFTPGHFVSNVGQALHGLVTGVTGSFEKGHEGEGGLADMLAYPEKTLSSMGEQSSTILNEAKAAYKRGGIGDQSEALTKSVFSQIPLMGPWLNEMYNKSMSGDVGGAAAQVGTNAAVGKLLDVMSEKGPALVNKASLLPKDIPNMFPKNVVETATHDAVQKSADAFKGSLQSSIARAKNEGVGKLVKKIADTDEVATQQSGQPAASPTDVLNDISEAKKLARVSTASPTPQTNLFAKFVAKQPKLTWENLKDLRAGLNTFKANATGKDLAVLGSLDPVIESRMSARAKALGLADDYEEYTSVNKDLQKHQNGIVSDLLNKNNGLDLFNELKSPSNRPQLNDLFNILEKHGSMPKGLLDDFLKSHDKLVNYASTTERGGATSRLIAIRDHMVASGVAGGAVAGAMGLVGASPMLRYLASLTGIMKAAELADRYDAVVALRERGGRTGVPVIDPKFPRATLTPSGTTPTGGGSPTAPSPAPPIVGGPSTPTQPTPTPSGLTPTASTGTGAPAPPATLNDLMSRISNASKRQQVVRESTTKSKIGSSVKQDLGTKAKQIFYEKQRKAELSDVKPYESFGVKIDKDKLTTPEAVRSAKEDGTRQIEELARTKFKEIQKLNGEARASAIKQLDKDMRGAKRSLDRIQTPDVSRGARDRVRKAVDAGAVKPSTTIENMSPEEVAAKAATGVTENEAGMMEYIDLGREAEKSGSMVLKAFNEIIKQAGGDDQAALPQLRALMEHVRKAKIPTESSIITKDTELPMSETELKQRGDLISLKKEFERRGLKKVYNDTYEQWESVHDLANATTEQLNDFVQHLKALLGSSYRQ